MVTLNCLRIVLSTEQLFEHQAISPRSVTAFLAAAIPGEHVQGNLVINLRRIGVRAKAQNVPDGFTILSAAKVTRRLSP